MIGWAIMEELLNKTDVYGRTLIESFHQGCRMNVSAIFHEWRTIETSVVTPQDNIAANVPSTFAGGVIGRLGTDTSFSLLLNAYANTPAATNGPASLLIPQVRLQGDYTVGLLFGPEHRVIPFQGNVFPIADNAVPGGIAFAYTDD
jgi:hypothetical protein